ncbi:hypothetical protein [Chryseobacterium arthrosphaerae]|uniref:hypothetical protein n=1 Tax=Chryseobacterium arthrosphaerae TaxID=651561 RepID=UPI001F4A63D2|nr:hypothetical protein [Chryseobacterium arthrosphaerae]
MKLYELAKGARIIETIENYSLAAEMPIKNKQEEVEGQASFFDDEKFWKSVIKNPKYYWGKKMELYYFVVSDWIARVPGLYWSKASQAVRQHDHSDIAIQSKEWIEFNPIGKSKKVMGGVGTLLLPPTDDGKVLLSASATCNASTGIPLLFYPEVLETLKIRQGDCLIIRDARWQPMDIHWASKFASTMNIPRGYLVIDSIEKVHIEMRNLPVEYHPFSLMEYEYKDGLLYDFVYVTADSKVKNVDSKIEDFFKYYSKKDGRNGEYLLNPNIVDPIFESRYSSPIELTHASEKAKLNLLYERIKGVFFKEQPIEELIVKLPQYYQSSTEIKTLARNIGVNVSHLVEDSAASMSAQLINKCLEKGIIEILIDRIVLKYPQIFN